MAAALFDDSDATSVTSSAAASFASEGNALITSTTKTRVKWKKAALVNVIIDTVYSVTMFIAMDGKQQIKMNVKRIDNERQWQCILNERQLIDECQFDSRLSFKGHLTLIQCALNHADANHDAHDKDKDKDIFSVRINLDDDETNDLILQISEKSYRFDRMLEYDYCIRLKPVIAIAAASASASDVDAAGGCESCERLKTVIAQREKAMYDAGCVCICIFVAFYSCLCIGI